MNFISILISILLFTNIPLNNNLNIKSKNNNQNNQLNIKNNLKKIENKNLENLEFIENEEYFIKSTLIEIEYFTKEKEKFIFSKKIKDIFNQELYYLQFSKNNAIININNYETLEITKFVFNLEEINNNIIYIPSIGLVYKKNNDFFDLYQKKNIDKIIINKILLSKNEYFSNLNQNKNENKKNRDNFLNKYKEKEKEKNIFKRTTPTKEILLQGQYIDNNYRVSHEVSHSWWFRLLTNQKLIGYVNYPGDDDNDLGLCQYISASMLLLYHELFISSGYFTDNEIDRFFILPHNETTDISKGLLEHKYYENNNPKKSFVRFLWELNDQKIALQFGRTFNKIIRNFLKDEPIFPDYDVDWSTSLWSSSNPEDRLLTNKVPVILNYVENRNSGHAIIIYGYDQKTNKYLTHWGWSGKENSQRLISKSQFWRTWRPGYWYTFYHKNNAKKNTLKKLFSYNGNKYSSKELRNMGVI